MKQQFHFLYPLLIFTACQDQVPDLKDPNTDTENPTPPTTTLGSRPNIILMIADDMGIDDMSYRGNTAVKTPNLDSLAYISTRFENFFVNSVSAPTRASLLTGRHFMRTGVSGLHAGREYVNLDEATLGEMLQKGGYETGLWGKWHSGKSNGYYPWQRGYDEAFMATLYHFQDNAGQLNGIPHQTKGWVDKCITDMALDFIDRNQEKPFFATISFLSVHANWAAPEEYITPYRGQGQSAPFSTLNGMISHLDHQVGRVINHLDSLGIAENTLILFMSDNGPNMSSDGYSLNATEWTLRNPSGYTGYKSRNYDNGIRSPFFVYWKGKTIPMSNHSLVSVMDIFPTLCELAKVKLPQDKTIDGKSIVPLIKSPGTKDESRSIFISHYAPNLDDALVPDGTDEDKVTITPEMAATISPELQRIGMRKGGYKLLLNEIGADPLSFWNLENDHTEQKNNNLYTNKKVLADHYKEEVLTFYKSLLQDEGSFTRPTFIIDGSEAFHEIFAYSPETISNGLINESHQLSGFDQAGEYASYSVQIKKQGDYTLMLKTPKTTETMTFRIATNLNSNCGEVTVDQNKYSSTKLSLYLDKGVDWIRLELVNTLSKSQTVKSIVITP